jgi:tetratricopeptide (TPR) repeat protein
MMIYNYWQVKDEENFTFHSSLGVAYHRRFEHLQDPMDLNSSIQAKRMVLRTIPKDHPAMAQSHASYGAVLFQRYELSRRQGDLEESLQMLEKAVELTPLDHPARPLRLLNLAQAMRDLVFLNMELAGIEKAIKITEEVIPLLDESNMHLRAGAFFCLAGALRMKYMVNKRRYDRCYSFTRNFLLLTYVINM